MPWGGGEESVAQVAAVDGKTLMIFVSTKEGGSTISNTFQGTQQPKLQIWWMVLGISACIGMGNPKSNRTPNRSSLLISVILIRFGDGPDFPEIITDCFLTDQA